MEYKIQNQARGTRIIFGEQVMKRLQLQGELIEIAEGWGYNGIQLPSIEPARIYEDKAGKEILGQMYTFPDKKGRELCLRPEVTATIQELAKEKWRHLPNLRLWYFEKCWRYEKPQRGRYREFWQFGCEVINPTDPNIKEELLEIATEMVARMTDDYVVTDNVKRGLDYYVEDGFEISCPQLGAQKQVCGGGRYEHGIGFAIGFDRLMLCTK